MESLCVAVSNPVLQSSNPPSLWNIAVWRSWYREDPAGQGRGQRQWDELHQHQGGRGFGSGSLHQSSLYLHWHRMLLSRGRSFWASTLARVSRESVMSSRGKSTWSLSSHEYHHMFRVIVSSPDNNSLRSLWLLQGASCQAMHSVLRWVWLSGSEEGPWQHGGHRPRG